MTRIQQLALGFFIAVFCSGSLLYGTNEEPRTEYEKPGYHPGHAYDSILPEETVDLFTGGLQITQQDVPVQHVSAVQDFAKLISRSYSSKIFRQSVSGACSPTDLTIYDDSIGLGWTLHFGRLWDPSSLNPVLELPDGSRHAFYADTVISGRKISKSMWTLLQGVDSGGYVYYDACSPGPEQICLRFNAYADSVDSRDQRLVYHARDWYLYSYQQYAVGINYQWIGGFLHPAHIWFSCGGYTIYFNYAGMGLDSIQYRFNSPPYRVWDYSVIEDGGVRLLKQVTTPEGRTYDYTYDSQTKELVKIVISSNPTIGDADDLQIEYTYESVDLPASPAYLSEACSRVITSKKVTGSDSTSDVWSYAYPGPSASEHIVTVTEPRGHTRRVTFGSYPDAGASIWSVGLILSEQTIHGGGSTLIQQDRIYDFKELTGVQDTQAFLDTVKIPVLLELKISYPQTDQQAIVSYGTASDYDRYGNPDFKVEKEFGGAVFRKTAFKYAHRDGVGSEDAIFEQANFVGAVSEKGILNGSEQVISEVDYDYWFEPGWSTYFGLLKRSTTWNDEAGVGNVVKDFRYDRSPRQLSEINEQTETGTRRIRIDSYCGRVWGVDDDLYSAGDIFHANTSSGGQVYTTLYSRNGSSAFANFDYDNDKRLVLIDPAIGDSTVIDYDDATRTVTITRGSEATVERYDEYGRLKQREVKISNADTSIQTFGYDEVGNVISESEKKLNGTPNYFVTKTYDALNRVTSITTADGLTEYVYNGPNVSVRVHSETGILTTSHFYDAGGRLIQVIEPNGVRTSYTYDAMDRLIQVNQNDNADLNRSFVYSSRGKLISETHPESGTTTYKYDLLARMIEKKTAEMGVPIRYSYDIRDRVLKIDYPNDADVNFYYDGDQTLETLPPILSSETYTNPRGHLTGMVDATGTSAWTDFSILDQLLQRKIYLNGISNPLSIQYTYDSRGNVDSILYPSGQKIQLHRNDANAIDTIQRQYGTASWIPITSGGIQYNAALLPSHIPFHNGVSLTIAPDPRNRPDLINSSGKLTLDYRYNTRGLIDQIATSQNGSTSKNWTMSYDNLGRIANFSAPGDFLTNSVAYSFDYAGNLLSKTGTLAGGPYTYNGNRINGVSYSADGDQLSAGGVTLLYNDENRIKEVMGTGVSFSYSYDGKGNRISSFNQLTGAARYFFYDESGTLLSEMTRSTTSLLPGKDYVNGPTGTLAVINYDELVFGGFGLPCNPGIPFPPAGGSFDFASAPVYYNFNDHLGTTRVVTDSFGQVAATFAYYPFGELLSSTGCAKSNQQFTGKLKDPESGLQYFGARYLSNDLTRFTSVDPAASSFDPTNPQSWNRYSYSKNDPLNRIDRDGREDDPVYTFDPTDPRTGLTVLGVLPFVVANAAAAYDKTAEAVATIAEIVSDAVSDDIPDPGSRNPYGSQGKPDHQKKVDELFERALGEFPNDEVIRERKIRHPDSNRRPDVQVVDPDTGEVKKIYEAERHPESKRNRDREAEYRNLKIPCDTCGLDDDK